jgi:hypothetical protein
VYKIIITSDGSKAILKTVDGGVITFSDPSHGNTDYEEYLKWLSAGNTPEPPDVLPEPGIPAGFSDRIEALELIVNGIIS